MNFPSAGTENSDIFSLESSLFCASAVMPQNAWEFLLVRNRGRRFPIYTQWSKSDPGEREIFRTNILTNIIIGWDTSVTWRNTSSGEEYRLTAWNVSAQHKYKRMRTAASRKCSTLWSQASLWCFPYRPVCAGGSNNVHAFAALTNDHVVRLKI